MDLSDRMKMYESVPKTKLIRRMPVIIRVDGKAFHTLTRKLDKPFDSHFETVMDQTALAVVKDIQNCVLAYIQSDEISFLLIDYKTLQTEPWFGNDLQKIVSISAATTSYWFSFLFCREAIFDSRAFNLPKEEVCNYFIWRQQDATRNSIQGLAQKYFSHTELHNLNLNKLQDKLILEKNINWNDLPTRHKRGRCILKIKDGMNNFYTDNQIPIFTQDREYIEKYLHVEEN